MTLQTHIHGLLGIGHAARYNFTVVFNLVSDFQALAFQSVGAEPQPGEVVADNPVAGSPVDAGISCKRVLSGNFVLQADTQRERAADRTPGIETQRLAGGIYYFDVNAVGLAVA